MIVPTAPTPKRPYQSPRLLVYGTVRELTGNTDNGNARGGRTAPSSGAHKTS